MWHRYKYLSFRVICEWIRQCFTSHKCTLACNFVDYKYTFTLCSSYVEWVCVISHISTSYHSFLPCYVDFPAYTRICVKSARVVCVCVFLAAAAAASYITSHTAHDSSFVRFISSCSTIFLEHCTLIRAVHRFLFLSVFLYIRNGFCVCDATFTFTYTCTWVCVCVRVFDGVLRLRRVAIRDYWCVNQSLSFCIRQISRASCS